MRDVRLVLLFLAMADAGDWLYGAALVVYMLDATGSAGWVAAIGVVRLVPWVVFSPPAGVLADRVSRRGLLVGTSIAQAAVMLAMAAVALGGGDPAIRPRPRRRGSRNGRRREPRRTRPRCRCSPMSATSPRSTPGAQRFWSLAMVVGPVLGGLLLVLGSAAAAFTANAVALLLAAGCAALIRTPVGPFADERAAADRRQLEQLLRSALADVTEGARSLASSWATGALVLVAAMLLFAYEAQVVLWAVLTDTNFQAGAESLTLLYAVYGTGGVAATIPATRRRGPQHRRGAGGRDPGRRAERRRHGERRTWLPRSGSWPSGVVVTMADVLGITLLQRAAERRSP
ncbi:MAG: hypothetical protein U0838_00015 [Chloroflexota bacterium]